MSVVLCSILRLYALFTFEKGKINKFLMYFHCIVIVILNCPLKEVFCIEIFDWDLEKVSVVRRCLLGTVRYIDKGFV